MCSGRRRALCKAELLERRASLALLNASSRRLLVVLLPRRLRQVCVLGPARVDCSLARVQLARALAETALQRPAKRSTGVSHGCGRFSRATKPSQSAERDKTGIGCCRRQAAQPTCSAQAAQALAVRRDALTNGAS